MPFDPRPRVPPALQLQEAKDAGPLLKVTNNRQGAVLMQHHGVPDFLPGVTLVPLSLLDELHENVQEQIRDHVQEGWLHFAAYDPAAEAMPVPDAPRAPARLDPRVLPADEDGALASVAVCKDAALLDYWFNTQPVARVARVADAIAARHDQLTKR